MLAASADSASFHDALPQQNHLRWRFPLDPPELLTVMVTTGVAWRVTSVCGLAGHEYVAWRVTSMWPGGSPVYVASRVTAAGC